MFQTALKDRRDRGSTYSIDITRRFWPNMVANLTAGDATVLVKIKDKKNVVWLTWEEHRRTQGICDELGIELRVITFNRSRWIRYPVLAARSFRYLLRRRPDVLIVQNPSLVLTAFASILRHLFGYKLIVDAHNEAVHPYVNSGSAIRWLTRRLLIAPELVIVTNSFLADDVTANGGTPFVLPDRIPTPPHFDKQELSDRFNIALISTFAKDEPVSAVFEAIGQFGDQVKLHVTGNANRLDPSIRTRTPDNVQLMGFLSEHDYWSLLNSVDAVIDLTLMDNCLVCGAYEAVAANKPLILSDNRATRQHFSRAAVYVENSPAAIADGLETMMRTHRALSDEAPQNKRNLIEDWKHSVLELENALSH